jgi:hypothetical protein
VSLRFRTVKKAKVFRDEAKTDQLTHFSDQQSRRRPPLKAGFLPLSGPVSFFKILAFGFLFGIIIKLGVIH